MEKHITFHAALIVALACVTLGCESQPTLAIPAHLSGFHSPESVLYDSERDVYWVSNMGEGGALAHDGDGFISRVDPHGTVERRFISSDRPGAALDSPKGMAIVAGELYVADIDRVRVFDTDTGAPSRELVVDGAELLNDIAASSDGTLYVTDTAVDASFAPTGHDAIYRISSDGEAERWLSGSELGNPNGIAIADGAIWVVTYGSGELIELTLDGEIRARHAAPMGGLDGITPLDDDSFLISSWAASAILVGTRAGAFQVEREGVEAPADLGFDPTRGLMLLPLMNAGEVLIDTPRSQ